MSGQSWVVGATSECDVVVSEATVSGRHCQLTQTPDGFVLEDLGSTNGTYVNGQRVVRPRHVSASDDITLGRTVRLPWPNHLFSPGSRTIRIGRAADNHVILDHAEVSQHHAQLTVHGNTMTLEDLGSSAGTAIGSPERRITKASVGRDDTVFFGSAPVSVSTLVHTTSGEKISLPAGPGPAATASASVGEGQSIGTGPLVAIAAGGAVLMAMFLGLVIVAIGTGDRSANEDPPRRVTWRSERENEGHEKVTQATSPDGPRSSDVEQERETPDPADNGKEASPSKPEPGADATRAAGTLSDALCQVLVGNEAGEFYRVGTAWAVEPKTLVSSGSVAMMARSLQSRFPQALLFHPARNAKIPIVSITAHPRYEEAAAACDEAESELGDLRARLDELRLDEDVTSADDIDPETLRDAMLEARLKVLKTAEKQVYFDAAVIRISQPIETCLSLVPSEDHDALRPRMKVRTTGLAFDFKDPFFDPARARPATLAGRIAQVVSYDEGSFQRVIVDVEKPGPSERVRGQLEYAYVGSPVVNEQEEVIAVYSRPTPSSPKVDEPPDGRSFDAALVRQIREVLAVAN